MEKPDAENPPIVRTDVAVQDVTTTVDHILARRGLTKLNLMGWSWGTTTTGRYATQNSEKVNRLVLYAPAWTSEPATGTQAPLGAYQTWQRDGFLELGKRRVVIRDLDALERFNRL